MKRFNRTALATAVGLAVLGLGQVTKAQTFTWTTVVNNGVTVPACTEPTETRLFNSYSQPSVNEVGLVVFRGRSKGSDGGGGEGGGQIAVAAAPSGEQGQPAREGSPGHPQGSRRYIHRLSWRLFDWFS